VPHDKPIGHTFAAASPSHDVTRGPPALETPSRS